MSKTADVHINLKYDGLQKKNIYYFVNLCTIIGDDGFFFSELVAL